MHLITRKTLRTFWQQHPDSKTALERWSQIIERNNFDSFTQLRATFPNADLVGTLTVFNIGGNKYRLIAAIHFNRHKVYIRHILTHAEYDQDNWKL
jgi:mRNA interferase HigB